MKVVIADDEQKICQLIQLLIDWEALGMEIAAVVHNGVDAVEAVKEYQPDIMITDIKMPGYDGLEMISRAKEINPELEFIIISGYRNFNYAQQAIKYGVKDYLLKPIGEQELREALNNIRVKYMERKEALSQEEALKMKIQSNIDRIRVDALKLFLNRKYRMEDMALEAVNEAYHFHFQAGCFRMVMVKLDGIYHVNRTELEYMEHKVLQILEHKLRPVCIDMECTMEPDAFCIILNYEPDVDIRRTLNSILEELVLQKEIFEHLEVTIGLGLRADHISDIYYSQKSAVWAVEQRLMEGTNRIIEGKGKSSNDFADSEIFLNFNKEMTRALDGMDVDAVRSALRYLQKELQIRKETNGHEVLQMAKETMNLYLFHVRRRKHHSEKLDELFEVFNSEINKYGSVDGVFRYLTRIITSSFEEEIEMMRSADTRPIREAKKYIEDNYQKPITLEIVSNEVGFNPAYFSTLFKKETDTTFSEYLQEYRINQAKLLLKETNMSIQSVCETVGYNDMKSFKKVFVKYAGLNPRDFRKLYS